MEKMVSQPTNTNKNTSIAIQRLILLLLLPFAFVQAFAGGITSHSIHYGKTTVQNATGNGTVYLSSAAASNSGQTGANDAGNVNGTSWITWNCGENSNNDSKTYYPHGTPAAGYYYAGWATSATATTYTAGTTGTTLQATSTNSEAPTPSTVYGFFKPVGISGVTVTPTSFAATNPSTMCTDYMGTAVFTTTNASKVGDFQEVIVDTVGNGRFDVVEKTYSDNKLTVRFKFTGDGTYGGLDRTTTATFTLTSFGGENSKTTEVVTGSFPDARILDGWSDEKDASFTTAAAEQPEIEITAVFDVEYVDDIDNFNEPTISGAYADHFTYKSMSYANDKLTVKIAYSGKKEVGTHIADLTLKVNDAIGGLDDTYGSKTVSLVVNNEQESDIDARVTSSGGNLLKEGTWAECLDVANKNINSTLKVLRNVSGLNANQKITGSFTLDLNGKTLTGKYDGSIIYMNTAGVTLTIKDSRNGGRIQNVNNAYGGIAYCVNVEKGNLILESGTLYSENKGASGRRAVAVYNKANTTVTINGGKLEAQGYNDSYSLYQEEKKGTPVFTLNDGELVVEGVSNIYGIWGYGKVNINGGTINATATYNNSRGITLSALASTNAAECIWGTLTMHGGVINSTCTSNADGTRSAYGILFDCSNAAMGTATATDGSHANKAASVGTIQNATINVSTLGRYAYGVRAYGSYQSKTNTYDKVIIKNSKIDVTSQFYYTYGVYASCGINSTCGGIYAANIELTDCDVSATTTKYHTAYAVFSESTYATIYKNVQPNYYGEYAGGATVTINSGTYTATTGTSTAFAVASSTRSKTLYDSETNVATDIKRGGNAEGYAKLIIHGGTFKGTAGTTTSRAVSSGGITTIDGGTFEAYSNGTTAYGLYAVSGKLTASGVKISASATQYAYGAMADIGIPDGNQAQTGFAYAGELELNNCEIEATTRTSTEARGVFVNAKSKLHCWATFEANATSYSWAGTTEKPSTTKQIYKNIFPCTIEGRDSVAIAIAGKATINGCTINATSATTTAYGIYTIHSYADVINNRDSIGSPDLVVKNTTINSKTLGTTTAYGIYCQGKTLVDGCNITVQPKTTTGYGIMALAVGDTTTVKNTKINVTANHPTNTSGASAIGLYGNVAIAANNGIDRHGTFVLEGDNDVTATTTSGTTAYALYLGATNRNINVANNKYNGDYANAAVAIVNGGKYTATSAGTTAYALCLAGQQVKGEAIAQPELTVNGGKFKGYATGGTYADINANGQVGSCVLNGGYYVYETNLTKYAAEDRFVKALATTRDEYKEGYRYEIAEQSGNYTCQIGSTKYPTLVDALQYVNQNTGTYVIYMIDDDILPKGDYILPANATLLLPYKSGSGAGATTIIGTTASVVTTYTTPTMYRKVTLAKGANLTVQGTIECSAQQASNNGGSATGCTTGPYGRIHLMEGSHIDLESGSKLICWGYITGEGTIAAKNGATTYENFEIAANKGGTIMSNMNGNSQKVFPIDDYFIQNIESEITYYQGAKALASSSLSIPSGSKNAINNITIIGNTNDYLFKMSTDTSRPDMFVRKKYDPTTDRITWTLNNGAQLSSLKVKVYVQVNASDYVLPISSAMDIVMNYGTLSIVSGQDVLMAPGSKMIIKKNATFQVPTGVKFYLYDVEQWEKGAPKTNYAYTASYQPDRKAPNPRAGILTNKTNLPSAEIFVQGKLDLYGSFQTTGSGANIHSTNEDAGEVIFNTDATASGTVYQYITGSTYNKSTTTAAQLRNGDGSLVPTAGSKTGDVFIYRDDVWVKVSTEGCFKSETISGVKHLYAHPKDFVEVTANNPDDHAYYVTSDPSRSVIQGADCEWIEAEKDGSYYKCINPNSIYYNSYFEWSDSKGYWVEKMVTIKFNNQGTVTTYSNIPYKSIPKYLGAAPIKTDKTDNSYYNFTGWDCSDGKFYSKDADLAPATEAVTYTAHFEQIYYTVTATFQNSDGKVLEKVTVNKGSQPSSSITPEKAADAEWEYSFSGWSPALSNITTSTTYTAQYTPVKRKYTVTFLDYDAKTVLDEKKVEYNTNPTYTKSDPEREGTSAFSYEFTGWKLQSTGVSYGKGETLPKVTSNQNYIAQYEQTEIRYKVTFMNDDGTSELWSKQFTFEAQPVYGGTPTRPVKEQTAEFTYNFEGWATTIGGAKLDRLPIVTGEATYYALFSKSTRKYIISFSANGHGSAPSSQNIDYGAKVTKPADLAETGYTFGGWYKEPECTNAWDFATETVTSAQTLYAKWTFIPYTITWKNEDGTVLETDNNQEYGKAITYDGATPTKAADAQYTYAFKEWTKDGSPVVIANERVTGNATYVATYDKTINKYTVVWKNHDGATLETDENVEYGKTPQYDGSTPTKDGDVQYSYTFKEWIRGGSPVVIASEIVTGDVTYIATFTESVNKYTITWKNADGSTLKTDENIPYGTTPTYTGATPTKAADAQYTYTHSGWTPTIVAVAGDATYTATFDNTLNQYTIRWLNHDGSELEKDENVDYGTMPTYDGSKPVRLADAQYTYEFAGWDSEISTVTGNKAYTAQYTPTLRQYDITFRNIDGKGGQQTVQADYGTTAEDLGKMVSPEYVTDCNSYPFTDWSPALETVTSEASYTATFSATPVVRQYELSFDIQGHGTAPVAQSVDCNTTATEPAAPTADGCEFEGWYKEAACTNKWDFATDLVTSNIVLYAKWKVLFYTISFDTQGGTAVESIFQAHNTTVTAPAAPTKVGYTFAGWTPAVPTRMPAANTVCVANWTPNTNTAYTVRHYKEQLDGTYSVTPETENLTGTTGASVTPAVKNYTGFTAPATETKTIAADGSMVIEYRYTRNSYTLSWTTDGDALTGTYTQGSVKFEAPITAPNTPTKTGYTFSAWSPAITTMPAVSTNCVAQFTPNTNTAYQVRHYKQQLDGSYSAVPEIQNLTGTTAQDVTPATKTYSGFTAPATETKAIAADGSMVIDYYYTRNTYTLTWSTDGDMLTGEYTRGNVLFEAPITAPATPTKTGHTFNSWTPAVATTMPAANTTYTATWTPLQFTITWNATANGGTCATATSTKDYGTALGTLPTATKDGCVFEGWFTLADGGTKIDATTIVTDNITYYAHFSAANIVATVTTTDGTTTTYTAANATDAAITTAWTQALAAANTAANVGCTLKLYKNVKANNNTGITNSFTLDLNGCTLSCSTNETTSWRDTYPKTQMFMINGAYSLTINDSGEGGTISYTGSGNDTYYAFNIYNTSAVLTINGGTIEVEASYTYRYNTGNATTVYLYDTNSTLNINGGTLKATAKGTSYAVEHNYSWGTYYGKTNITGGKLYASTQIIYNRGTARDILSGGYYNLNPGTETTGRNQDITIPTGYEKISITNASDPTEYGEGYRYKIRPKQYTITFKDGDNNTLESKSWDYGSNPYYDGTPTKTATAQYEYEFNGTWSPAIETVTKAATYTAQFDQKLRSYDITFANLDGKNTWQETVTVEYGQTPICPVTPEKYDDNCSYEFIGWDKTIAAVTGATTYTAKFSTACTARKHQITFDPDNGDAPTVVTVNYGEMPTAPANPTKEDAQYYYTFTGWTPEIAAATQNATYTATYSTSLRSYTIRFVDHDNRVLQTTTEPYGVVPTAPADPTRSSYIFSGWSPAVAAVTGEQTYTAQYIEATVVASVTPAGGTAEYFSAAGNTKAQIIAAWDKALARANQLHGSTLKLYKDVEVEKLQTISANMTIDLNGCTLSRPTTQGNVLLTYAAIALTINDSKGGGKIYINSSYNSVIRAIGITGAGTLTVNGGTIQTNVTSSYAAYAVYVQAANAKVYINGGELISNSKNTNSYAVYNYNTSNTVQITGGKLKAMVNNNISSDYASVFYRANVVTASGGYYSKDPGAINVVSGYAKKDVTASEPEYNEKYRKKVVKSQCDITWMNEDGSKQLEIDRNVPAGNATSYDGETPTKEATAQYTFTFDGWATEAGGAKVYDNGATPVASDNVTYYAHFTSTLRSYTVTWQDDDGSAIRTDENQPYGSTPTAPADPTKAADAEWTYTFSGWTPAISAVSGDQTYTATYTRDKNSYTITWQHEDGTQIDQTTVEYGVVPTHADDSKANTAAYTYTFKGWSTDGSTVITIPAVTGPATYKAVFEATKNTYTITWLDDEGTKIDDTTVEYGVVPTHDDATKANTAEYTYTFKGWSNDGSTVITLPSVTGNATYKAVFDKTKNTYTITWLGEDDTEIEQTTVEYGTVPTHAAPTKTNTDEFTYTFAGWSEDGVTALSPLPAVERNATYKAIFTATKNTYTITWLNDDGTEIDQTTVEYNDMPTHADATKANTAEWTYTFNGWTPTIVPVTGNATYKAVFEATANEFGEYLDIVGWEADANGKVTAAILNMNGFTSPTAKTNWKVVVNGITYTKTDRDDQTKNPDADRTMRVNLGSMNADEQFVMQTLGTGDVVESKHSYTVPYIYRNDIALRSVPEGMSATSIIYVSAGTLTINADMSVSKVIVNPGAELVVPSGKTLTVGTLVLRTEAFASAVLTDNGTITVTENTYYTRRVADNTQHYQLGLPFDVTVANITLSNGKATSLGSTYGIMTYDAQARAEHGKNDANWVNELSLTTLKAKTGYQLLSSSKYYTEFYFPVTYTKTTDGDGSVSVYAHHDATTTDADRDWNYIVSPYTHVYNITAGDPADYPKIAVLGTDNKNFYQDVMNNLKPATPFYYQAAEDGTLMFGASASVQKVKSSKFQVQGSNASQTTQWIRLALSEETHLHTSQNNDPEETHLHASLHRDLTNIYISDRFENRYEVGYDVVKLSTVAERPLVWTSLSYGDLAFAALPDSIATEQIPLTFYAPAAGKYTLTLEANEYMNRIESLYLYDALTGATIDLMSSTYELEAQAGEWRGRLFLKAVMAQMPDITTDIIDNGPLTTDIEKPQPQKIMIDGYVYILMPDGRVYDATGKQVSLELIMEKW